MESEAQYSSRYQGLKEVQQTINRLASNLLQSGAAQTPQVPTPAPILQAGASGFDPNDLQPCCTPNKIIIITKDGKEHDWQCPVAETDYNQRYSGYFDGGLVGNLKPTPKCDCGGETAKTTHAGWCSSKC